MTRDVFEFIRAIAREQMEPWGEFEFLIGPETGYITQDEEDNSDSSSDEEGDDNEEAGSTTSEDSDVTEIESWDDPAIMEN